ncbi:MAG TPA: 4-(cytidine 5'-diphospho)-2-C-methyl-D-erythritol kinase [Candidatus Gastranaerophilales bacterium]|nr:4-(cytidine 5'-diphospho)-2-C-methyl-D-erythritol kinase [Candidatus Gastranaerophilales bacterium]
MKKIKIKTPAKLNLVLEILGKRKDGFHEIRSIMQAINLFDFLSVETEDNDAEIIKISGNNPQIPYDENNIAFKAAKMFLKTADIKNQKVNIHIEKNIPVAAGLAGGSSNAAGTLWGINKLYGNPLSADQLHFLASELGSDVNFCLTGGTCQATSRGEKIQRINTPDLKFLIVKPSKLFISAKEAYQKYSGSPIKSEIKNFDTMKKVILEKTTNIKTVAKLLNNDLEKAILQAYPEINKVKQLIIKAGCQNAIMSGSGPTVFGIYENDIKIDFSKDSYDVFKAVSINYGVKES